MDSQIVPLGVLFRHPFFLSANRDVDLYTNSYSAFKDIAANFIIKFYYESFDLSGECNDGEIVSDVKILLTWLGLQLIKLRSTGDLGSASDTLLSTIGDLICH